MPVEKSKANKWYNLGMETLMKSDIFFFISSIGFIILFTLLGIAIYYLIRAFKKCDRILAKAEKDISHMGDTAKNMMEDVRDSTAFRLFVGKKKTKK